MSETIFEYKNENSWYLVKWDQKPSVSSFEPLSQAFMQAENCLRQLVPDNKGNYQLFVSKEGTIQAFIGFMLDILNKKLDTNFSMLQQNGSLLLLENEIIKQIILPKEGLNLSEFFSQELTEFGDTILIATRNEGKTIEFREFFKTLGLKVENLNDYPDLPEVEETGMTFEENARLKAETISDLTQKMVLADDSGLKVDALGGLPGVWSARFSAPNPTDEKNNAKLLHELAMVFEKENRSAQFHSTLVVAAPGKESLVVEADWPGYIATEARGDFGFGYDPLFIVGETEKHAAELSPEEKNKISHRGLAIQKLLEEFPEWQKNA